MREKILSLLSGQKIDTIPAFSGLIHVTNEGLKQDGHSLHEVHHNPRKMARAAASTFKYSGMPSATLPLDLCTPAEALGAELGFEGESFPQVRRAVFESTKEIATKNTDFTEVLKLGRIEVVCEAISLLKGDIGRDVVISGIIPGPFTLLLYLSSPAILFPEMKREPLVVQDALLHLSSFLAEIGKAYRASGADFITIHDMGGSAGFIGPSKYEQLVFPSEKDLIERLPKPCVLSVCGRMDKSLHFLSKTGADAVSVDQLTDLKAARMALKDTLLFGNIDPVSVLLRGEKAGVEEAVSGAKEADVDAVWPGCDLVPSTPIQNIKSMVQ